LFFDSYNLIRGLDIIHPVYILQNNKEQFAKLSKYTDILAYDPYPPVNANLTTWVTNYTTTAVNGVCYKKPVWCLNKAYSATAQYDPSYPNTRLLPTIMEERNLWYQALFAGASSVGFYSFSDAIVTPRTAMYNTTLWSGLVEFASSEMGESYNYFLKHQYPVFSDRRRDDVWWSSYVKNGEVYMIVLNRNESETNVSIPLKNDRGTIQIGAYTSERIYGGTGTLSGNGSLDITLEASAAYVYKITPTASMDFGGLNTTKFHDLGDASWAAEQIRELENQSIITGTSKSAFSPNAKILKGEAVQFISNSLSVNLSTQSPYAEVSRQEMFDLCKNALLLKGSTIYSYILSEVMANVKAEILLGNISLSENVSRAEASYIIERILQWENQQNMSNQTLYNSIIKVNSVDIGILYNSLLVDTANEVYDNNLWYKKWTEDGKQYILVQNIDSTIKNINIDVSGSYAKLICGGRGSVYQNNVLTVNIPPNDLLLFEVMNEALYGVYDGNILLSNLESGNFKIKYPDISEYNDLIMVGLYVYENSNLELVSFLDTVKETDGWSFTVPALDQTKNYTVKSLMWDSYKGMHPYNQAYILE